MKVLIVEARYHGEVADRLADGATRVLEQAGAYFERLAVPGVLEIAPAMAMAEEGYDGFVGLGCVLRSAGFLFPMLGAESMRGLTALGVERRLCIGTGILLAEDEEEALTLADPGRGDAGGQAARACVALMHWRAKLGE